MMTKWWLLLFVPVLTGCMAMPIAPPAPPPPAGAGYAQAGAMVSLASCFLPLINLGLITLIAAALVFVGLGKGRPRIYKGRERSADCLEIVRQRYARGELTREEYRQMTRDLGSVEERGNVLA